MLCVLLHEDDWLQCVLMRGFFLFLFRCVKDPTFTRYSSPHRHILRFGFNAFQFVQSNSEVYLQCQLVVCRAYDYSSRCYQGCVHRSKREASSDEESVIVVAGPIQLWEPGSEIGGGIWIKLCPLTDSIFKCQLNSGRNCAARLPEALE